MVSMTVSHNLRRVARRIARIQKRQIPFAASGALNDTVFQVRKRIVGRTWPRAMKVRNRRFASAAFRVEKANKRTLRARLFDKLGRASMALHATGGTKKPRGGHLAVPSDNVRRTGTGKVPAKKRARVILSTDKAFKAPMRTGNIGVFEKTGSKKNRKVRLVHTLVRRAPIRKRFPFYEDAESTSRRAFPNNFSRRLARALATAR